MKCPSCGGEVPHVAIKCKHCGNALKKQAPPPAPAAKPKQAKPEDPMKALAREAMAQQKAKAGGSGKLPAAARPDGRGEPGGAPKAAGGARAQAKAPTTGKPGAASQAGEGAQAGGQPGPEGEGDQPIVPVEVGPVDARKRMIRTAAGGVALIVALAFGSQTAAAQTYLTNWAAGAAVRDVTFEMVEGEYLGAGTGQLRVPLDGVEIAGGLPVGTRGYSWDLGLDLAFRGKRHAAFTLAGKLGKYEDVLAEARALDPGARELNATYGKNAYKGIRYKVPPADGSVGKLRTLRYYQSKKESEKPFAVEFGYEEDGQNRVIMDKLIDRVLSSLIEP